MKIKMASLAKLGLSGGKAPASPRAASSSKAPEPDDPYGAIDAMLAAAKLSSAPTMTMQMGYLQKKSGGHDGKISLKLREHWDKRFFVLPADSSTLQYFKTQADFQDRKEPLGSVDIPGSTVYLKSKLQDGSFRFTVRSKERELKLKADSETDYLSWVQGLRPRAALFRELADEGDDAAASSRDRAASVRTRSHTAAPIGRLAQQEGWLEKKSSGRTRSVSSVVGAGRLLNAWERRYFALPLDSSTMSYYHNEHEMLAARPALGSVECKGAKLFLKEIKGGVYRFTVKTEERELKLRTESEADFTAWMDALGKYATQQNDGDDSDGDTVGVS